MKTLGLALLTGGIIGGLTGVVMTPKKEVYSASGSFTVEMPYMASSSARYATAGAVESWLHCGKCKQGVIRKEDGTCSFCGKTPNE